MKLENVSKGMPVLELYTYKQAGPGGVMQRTFWTQYKYIYKKMEDKKNSM